MNRPHPSRRALLAPLVFGVIVGIGITAWQNRQSRLDGALLEAICRDDAPAVTVLLNHGANPNAALTVGRPDTSADMFRDFVHWLRRDLVVPRNFRAPALYLVYDPAISIINGRGVRERRVRAGEPSNFGWPLPRPDRAAMVEALVRKGADLNNGFPFGAGPLSLAVRSNDYASVKLLLEHGANPNTGSPRLSTSPLLDADVTSARLLLDHGANPSVAGRYGETPLMHAVSGGPWGWRTNNVELVQLLLDHGVDVNTVDYFNQTALMHAVNVPYARILIDHGANVNARSRFGVTALMMACSARGYHDPALPAFLISRGASALAVDNSGLRARDFATTYAAGFIDAGFLHMLDAAAAAERKRASSPASSDAK